MKKTINIHLGGMPFIIDEDAYNILHNYIESLKAKFTNENERNEIIADIEARVAEVFTTRLEKDKRQVVEENDVNNVISQLGKPEDIAGNSASEAEQTTQSQQQTTYTHTTFTPRGEKKLFRDTDNKIVGGVISGLCQYFGYSEPIWARLAFVLLLFVSFGTPVFLYFVLWLVVPEAKTAADKLQMRGEAVTLDTIEKEVRDTINRAKDEINKNEVGKKASSIFGTLLKVIIAILSINVLIGTTVVLFAFLTIMGVSFSIADIPQFAPFTSLLFNASWAYYLAMTALFFAIGIPLFSIMYFCLKFLISKNFSGSKKLFKWLVPLWIASLVTLFIITISVVKNFTVEEKQTEELVIIQPIGDTLSIASIIDTAGLQISSNNAIITGIGRTENGFVFGDADVELMPSKDSLFHIKKVLSSQGRNEKDALKNIKMINYRYSQSGSVVSLQSQIEVFKNAKFRKQEVKTIVYIPQGKKLIFTDENFEDFNIGDDNFYAGELPNKVFAVKDGKVVCENCTTSNNENEDDSDTNISIDSSNISVHQNTQPGMVGISISGNGIKIQKGKDKNEKK